MPSKIEWTDETWPVVTGCSPVSSGCRNCWAARLAAGRLRHNPLYRDLAQSGDPPRWTGQVRINYDRFEDPLRWRKPRRVFVAATGDLFHKSVPFAVHYQIFQMMERCPRHTFQILTKRAGRLVEFIDWWLGSGRPVLPNVWLGVSVEDEAQAGRLHTLRLLEDRWPVRWASLEPLVGPVSPGDLVGLDWIVIGGESGKHARPMHPQWLKWVLSTFDGQVPLFFKQWGEWVPWADGDYTRCWLDLQGNMSPFDGPPPDSGAACMVRVGKQKARKIYEAEWSDWQEFPK